MELDAKSAPTENVRRIVSDVRKKITCEIPYTGTLMYETNQFGYADHTVSISLNMRFIRNSDKREYVRAFDYAELIEIFGKGMYDGDIGAKLSWPSTVIPLDNHCIFVLDLKGPTGLKYLILDAATGQWTSDDG